MKQLGRAPRRILLHAELYERRHGEAVTWHELGCTLDLPEHETLEGWLWTLRRDGLVTFTREPRSLRVTAEGLRAALLAAQTNGKPPKEPKP